MDRRGPTMPPLYGPFKSLPSSRDLGVGKGSTKNERKINPKRKEVAEEKIKTLRRDKALAKTKKEKKMIQEQIDHQQRKLKKSEIHTGTSPRH